MSVSSSIYLSIPGPQARLCCFVVSVFGVLCLGFSGEDSLPLVMFSCCFRRLMNDMYAMLTDGEPCLAF